MMKQEDTSAEPPEKKARVSSDAGGPPVREGGAALATQTNGDALGVLEEPAAAGEKKALTFEDRVKEVAGDKADFSKDLWVVVTSSGGTSTLDSVWEEAHLVPESVLGDELPVRRSVLRWPSFNYLEDFEADYPKLYTTIVPGTEAPYYIGSLEEFPEMTTWVARTVLKDIVNIDGMNW